MTPKDVEKLKEKIINDIQETENIDLDVVKKKINAEKQLTTKDKRELYEFAVEFDAKKRSSFRTDFDIDDEKYVYCFDDMTIDRIFTAKQMFSMEQEFIKHLPNNPQEMQILAKRESLRTAFAALLMKKLDKGGYEEYNISENSFNALSKIKGKEFQKLQKCKEDFFFKTSMQDNEQLALFKSTIGQLKELDQQSLETIMSAALRISEGQAETS